MYGTFQEKVDDATARERKNCIEIVENIPKAGSVITAPGIKNINDFAEGYKQAKQEIIDALKK
jgi:hypothetical protein